jgi:methyl-accepting chemotaxis protein
MLSNLFRYHGIWSLGVRLFRRMSFVGKATVISVIFLLVVAQLGFLYVRTINEITRASRQELLGLNYAKDLLTLISEAQALRHLTTASKGTQTPDTTRLVASMDSRLARLDAAPPPGMALSEPLKHVKDALTAAKAPASDATDAFRLTNELSAQLLWLMQALVDESGLALDPDSETFHLMQASTSETLNLLHEIGRMRDLGFKGMAAGALLDEDRQLIYGTSYIVYRDVEALFARYERVVRFAPQVKEALAFEEAFAPVNVFLRTVRRGVLAEGGPRGEAAAFAAAGAAAMQSVTALTTRSYDTLGSLIDARIERQVRSRNLQLAFVAAGLLIAAYFFYCFYLVTRGGMQEVTRHVEAMARGDLSTSPQPWGRDEAAALMLSIRSMQQSMRALIGQVRSCAETIAGTSNEVAVGAQDLMQRTERTSSSLQQTASAMEEIAATVQHAEGRTRESESLGRENAQVAGAGGEVIGQVVSTMEQIQVASKRVGEIIGVIDGIAFQTNILALNAAVEAARAGEQGRGFAVVAGEVRALAQRSASAARDIKQLIEASSVHTAQGALVVRSAGETMERLVLNTRAMSGLLGEVSAAASQQTQGVSEVSAAVAQLDEDTQRNAALVEQTSAVAASMKQQADELLATTARFTLASEVERAGA